MVVNGATHLCFLFFKEIKNGINSEIIEKQYIEFLYGFNDEDAKKFVEFIHNIQDNISCLAEYVEIDCDEWGNPY